MQPGELTEYAISLLERGYICLPLRAGGKHLDLAAMGYDPLHLRTLRKDLKELAFTSITFQLAQRSPGSDDIERWFRDFGGNIGILGGFSNLMILDFDDDAGYRAWLADHKAIANATPTAKSPSGFHVYLRSRQPIVSSSLHFGLRRVGHVKALGGYVVGSPSVLRDGSAYSWVKGRSPFDIEPRVVDDLGSLALRPVSMLKHHYNRLLKRGFFERQ